MSNIHEVRIIGDVAFDWMNHHAPGEGLPEAEMACVASALLCPSGGLLFRYGNCWTVPNDHGGQTAMYRLFIEGEEALPTPFLRRLALALKNSGPQALLHVAEARDVENHGRWRNLVDTAELSGEARLLG